MKTVSYWCAKCDHKIMKKEFILITEIGNKELDHAKIGYICAKCNHTEMFEVLD